MGVDYGQYPFAKGKHPAGWAETTVGDVMLEIRSGYSSGKHNQSGEGIPHLRPMNVSPVGDISMEDVRYISPGVGNLRLAENDVLFTNTSSTVWVGKTALVKSPGDWGFSNHMTRLRVAGGMSPEFVARQLHYLCLSGYFAFHCKKYINQSSVARKQLAGEVPFRLPPANEQTRIVGKLCRLLARERRLRQHLDALPALIQQCRSAVLEAACTGRLVPTEAELARREQRHYEPASALLERIPVERRAKWETERLAKMGATGKSLRGQRWKQAYQEPLPPSTECNITLPSGWGAAGWDQIGFSQNGRAFPSSQYSNTGVKLLRPGNLHASGEIRWTDSNTRCMPHEWADRHPDFIVGPRELVINLTAQSLKDDFLGRVCLTGRRECCLLNQRLARLSPVLVTPEYMLIVFKAPPFRRFVAGLNSGAMIQHMFTSQLANFWVPVPPPAEQKRIVAEVERRLSNLIVIEEQVKTALEQATQLRVSLFVTTQV